ncbi:MAG: hypothetical protein EPO24_04100 [Bacteroidetes bacterium]|nr:MAG: hypothetical protein EPO24_04100 [Bacteroidota bacterium]
MDSNLVLTIVSIVFILALCVKFRFMPFGMAMNIDKSKVVAEVVYLFIAERTSESTAVTQPTLAEVKAGGSATWKNCGGYESEQLKVNGEPFTITLMDGVIHQTGVPIMIDGALAQSDYTNLQLVEGFINKYIDVLLVVIGNEAKAYRYQRCGITVGYSNTYSRKNPATLPFKIGREADKITSAMDILTLS